MDSHAELARLGYDALNRQDWVALQELVAPDIEVQRAPGLGSVRGADDVVGFAAPGAFEYQHFEIVGEIEQRGGRLLVPLRIRARGAGSALELEEDVWHVVTVRDGRIARLEIHFDRESAALAFRA